MENQKKKDENLGDSARGQADPGSAAVYTMDQPGPVICMYVCVGTGSHPYGPTDPLVVVYSADTISAVRARTCIPRRVYSPGVAHGIPYLATGGVSSSHLKKIPVRHATLLRRQGVSAYCTIV